MGAFDHHVMGQDQRFATDGQDGAVIFQIAGSGVAGDGPQQVDKGGLAAQPRTSLATASSTPLTNFASRSSKKALATSTYSLIALPLGTSARAISS